MCQSLGDDCMSAHTKGTSSNTKFCQLSSVICYEQVVTPFETPFALQKSRFLFLKSQKQLYQPWTGQLCLKTHVTWTHKSSSCPMKKMSETLSLVPTLNKSAKPLCSVNKCSHSFGYCEFHPKFRLYCNGIFVIILERRKSPLIVSAHLISSLRCQYMKII